MEDRTPSYSEIPATSRRILDEREDETFTLSSYWSVSINDRVDVLYKMAQNDCMRVRNNYTNKALAKAEKDETHYTEDNDSDSSLPLSLEEMSSGRISPIQAKDVYPVIDGLNNCIARPKLRNIEAKENDFEEILKPSEGLMRCSENQLLLGPLLSHDQYSTSIILGNYSNEASHSKVEYTAVKDEDSTNSKLLFKEIIVSNMDKKHAREIIAQDKCDISSQKEGIEISNFLSNDEILNIDCPEKRSRAHVGHSNAEVVISSQSGGNSDVGIISDHKEMESASVDGVADERTPTTCCVESPLGLSWRIGNEKNAEREYLKSYCCQGLPSPKTVASLGLWENYKKVNLPDSSSYTKSLENRVPKYISLLLNNTKHSVGGNFEKVDSCEVNLTSNLRSENLCTVKKMLSNYRGEFQNNEQIHTAESVELVSQNKFLEQLSKRGEIGPNYKTNEAKTNKISESNSWESHACAIQTVEYKQEIQNKDLKDEFKIKIVAKSNLMAQLMPEEKLQWRLFKKLGNVTEEEPPIQILPVVKQLKKENRIINESHDICSSGMKLTGISEDFCDHEKKIATKAVVNIGLNISEENSKETEDNDKMNAQLEDIAFGKEIDGLLDIIAKREADLLLEGNMFARRTGNSDTNTFREGEDDLGETLAELCSSKGVAEENVHCPLSMEVTNDLNSKKSTDVVQMSHFGMKKTDFEEKEVVEFQMIDKEGANNTDSDKTLVKLIEEAETVEVCKTFDLENEQMKNVITGIHIEKVKELGDELNELRDVEIDFIDDGVKGRKLGTLDVCCSGANYKVKEDLHQPCHNSGRGPILGKNLISVPFERGECLDSEKDAIRDSGDSMSRKENDICTYKTEVDTISERANSPCVTANGDVPFNSEQLGQNNSIVIQTANSAIDLKETDSPMAKIIKKWKDDNCDNINVVEGGKTSELSLNSRSMENNEEDLSSIIEGLQVPINGKTECEEDESFICVINNAGIEDKCVIAKRENTGSYTLEECNFYQTMATFSKRPKDFVDGMENDVSNSGVHSEEIVISFNETFNNCKDEICEVTSFENFENGNHTIPISGLAGQKYGTKTNRMGEEDIVLDDCLEKEHCLPDGNVKCNTKKNLVEAHMRALPKDHDISKSMKMSDIGKDEGNNGLFTTLPMQHQEDALGVKISNLEEKENADGIKSLNCSSINELRDDKCVLGIRAAGDDVKFEIKEADEVEKNTKGVQVDFFADACTLNGSIELENTTDVEVSEGVKEIGGYSSQRGKDYMISGIELGQNYPRNNYECFSSENDDVSPLEIDSCKGNSIKAIVGDLKSSSEFSPLEFNDMENLSGLHPASLMLVASNGEDKDLNIAPDSESFEKNNELGNSVKKQSPLMIGSILRDVTFFNGFPTSSLSKDSNFDIDEIENSKVPKSLNFTTFPINCHEKKCSMGCLKNVIHSQDFDTDDSFAKPSNVIDENEYINDGMSDGNRGINHHSQEIVSESGPYDEFGKNDCDHESFLDLKSSEPLQDDIFEVNKEVILNEVNRLPSKYVPHELASTLMSREKNDNHQIVPDVTDTENIGTWESDLMAPEKRDLLLEAPVKLKSETEMNTNDTASCTFSLESYLDTLVDKQLSSEKKEDYMLSKSYHTCSQLADAGCQTQLCGVLHCIHSCECLETHLLSEGELENLQFKERKRLLQALNLESLPFRNKKIKLQDEIFSIDTPFNEIIVKDELSSKMEYTLNIQHPPACVNLDTKPIAKVIINEFGDELTTRESAEVVKQHANDWEELEDARYERGETRELNDQKVPDVVFQPDCLAGLEGKSQEISDSKQDANPRSFPSFISAYRSKFLRLGLSKRAKLPRLHHQK